MVYHTNNTIADYSDSTFGFKDFENTKGHSGYFDPRGIIMRPGNQANNDTIIKDKQWHPAMDVIGRFINWPDTQTGKIVTGGMAIFGGWAAFVSSVACPVAGIVLLPTGLYLAPKGIERFSEGVFEWMLILDKSQYAPDKTGLY